MSEWRHNANDVDIELNNSVNLIGMSRHFEPDYGRRLTREEVDAVQVTPIEQIRREPLGLCKTFHLWR